jgi:RimJ/RimL family protein N-acetyltransferase
MIIYRLDLTEPPMKRSMPAPTRCVIAATPWDVGRYFLLWMRNWGFRTAVRTALKVLSKRRILYVTVLGHTIVQSGWANLGFCRYYPVESDAVVLGTLYTVPEHRNKGFSTSAKSQMISFLYSQGFRRIYADTSEPNIAAQRTCEKLGFRRINVPLEAVVA